MVKPVLVRPLTRLAIHKLERIVGASTNVRARGTLCAPPGDVHGELRRSALLQKENIFSSWKQARKDLGLDAHRQPSQERSRKQGSRSGKAMGTLGRVVYSLGKVVRETGQALDRLGSRLQGANAYKEELSRHRTLMNVFDKSPVIDESVFVAPSAAIMGDVQIGEKSSIWYGCVLRGDVNHIRVGSETNIQDNTLVHVAKTNVSGNVTPTIIGNKVTVGHNSVLHACTVEDESFVGMGATILDGAVVEKGAMVAAGALVTQKTRIPSGQIWAGSPAKFLRDLTTEEVTFIAVNANNYMGLAEIHSTENSKTFGEIEADKAQRRKWDQQSDDYDSHLGITRSKRPQIAFPDKMATKGPH